MFTRVYCIVLILFSQDCNVCMNVCTAVCGRNLFLLAFDKSKGITKFWRDRKLWEGRGVVKIWEGKGTGVYKKLPHHERKQVVEHKRGGGNVNENGWRGKIPCIYALNSRQKTEFRSFLKLQYIINFGLNVSTECHTTLQKVSAHSVRFCCLKSVNFASMRKCYFLSITRCFSETSCAIFFSVNKVIYVRTATIGDHLPVAIWHM